ncbi:hypothetical protein F5880DRAFT_1512122 [Lentinula raphanica]|nr:hypothetical protein F5880DRAFT_1512122 [Lentinula raphanica]
MRGVQVMVVPRLHFADEDGESTASSSSKRKLPSRPSPQLFNPAKCMQEALIRRQKSHVYSYKSWRFEYGLQVKVLNCTSLAPARAIPLSLCRLFMDAKSMAGDHLIEMSSMPVPSFWSFKQGEKVNIHSDDCTRFGTLVSSTQKTLQSNFVCEVDVGGEIWSVPVRDLEKEIPLGHYVEVVGGVHLGKKGFVVGKSDTLLGICVGQDTNGLDFRVHANSVKLAIPDFSHTITPWVNVEVTVESGPDAGLNGLVKDVVVNSARSLSITVRLSNGQERVFGYHAVRETRTKRLLMDHQPLQSHQQHFNVEVPWKETEVIIQAGRFIGCNAIVKNVRRDYRGGLCLSLWVPRYRISIDIDLAAVCERKTRAPLLTYRPLEGHQLREFSISSSLESMHTGPVPWLDLLVRFVHGEYKAQYGFVKDVNRHQVKPSLRGQRSGLILTVERSVFTINPSSKLVKVDYDFLRYADTQYRLCEVFLPTSRQSFYMPDNEYQCEIDQLDVPHQLTESDRVVLSNPLANNLEQEALFSAAWTPSSLTPGRDMPTFQTSRAPSLVTQSLSAWNHFSWSPASPSALPFRSPSPCYSSGSSPEPLLPDHWILNPKLLGIPIKVDIMGEELDTLKKKDGIFVEAVAAEKHGINIIHRATSSKTILIPRTYIASFRSRPKPATEKALMVVVRNQTNHIGKLVRRVHHFFEKERTEDNHCLVVITVDRTGSKESRGSEFLDMHPDDLKFVKETAQERKWSTELLCEVRAEFTYSSVDVRFQRNTL